MTLICHLQGEASPYRANKIRISKSEIFTLLNNMLLAVAVFAYTLCCLFMI